MKKTEMFFADDAKTASQYLSDIVSLSQAVGSLGRRLRKCKPGSVLYQKTWDTMTEMENEIAEKCSAIRMFMMIKV